MPLSEQEKEELLKKIEEQKRAILQKTLNPYRLKNLEKKRTEDKGMLLKEHPSTPSDSVTTISSISDKIELAKVKRRKKLNVNLSDRLGSVSQLKWSLVVLVLLGSIAIIVIGIIAGYIVSTIGLPKAK